MITPLRLDKFWVEELIIQAAPDSNVQPEQPPVFNLDKIDYDVEMNKVKPVYRVRLVLDMTANEKEDVVEVFKRIRMVIWGQFSFSEEASEAFIKEVTPLNQVSILYGIARGIVASATALTAHGALQLPIVNFVEIMKSKTQQQLTSQVMVTLPQE